MHALVLPLAARLLVWAIAIGGVLVFIYRRIRGVPLSGPKPEEPVATGRAAPPPGARFDRTSPPGAAPPSLAGLAPVEPPLTTASGLGPPAGLADGGGPSVTQPAATPGAVPDPSSPNPSLAPTTSSTRGGFFAVPATDSTSGRARDPAAPRPTVAEAVRGIAMPGGLSPVIDGAQSLPNPFRVAFLTTDASAADVGRALADDLEHLGFSLSTSTATELLARRDDAELRVVLFPSPATARRGLDQMFPAAPPGSVGVEGST